MNLLKRLENYMNNIKLEECPLCGKSDFDNLYQLDAPVVQCSSCRLVFLNPQPRVEHQEFYDESYYRGTSEKKERDDNEDVLEGDKIRMRLEACQGVVDKVMQYQPQPGTWLDIGCGPGFLLSQVKARGWQTVGLDSSPFAPQFAKEQFGLENVHIGLIEDMNFKGQQFDVISMQHVIEHIYEPVATMKEILKLLKPNGILYLETPDIESGSAKLYGKDWLHIKIPEHVLYFSELTLKRLLNTLDCEVLGVQKPVPSTGLMHKVFGGEERAKRFYNVVKHLSGFMKLVSWVRKYQQKKYADQAEHIQILARKRIK